MLRNSTLDISGIRSEINKLQLSDKLNQDGYTNWFYYHLTSLIKFKLLSVKNDIDEIKFNQKNYLGLEQFIFENSDLVESTPKGDINWDVIDEAKDLLKLKLQKLLGNEGTSDYLKPFVKFSVESYENLLIYKHLHEGSLANPWIPTSNILDNGYLFLATDNVDLISQYNKKIVSNTDSFTTGNIGIVAKTNKKDTFSGFLVDSRVNAQGLVYEYLKKEAVGSGRVKNTTQIGEFLKQQNRLLTDNQIKNNITLPLKRAGLIGSTTAGFYFINSLDDLILSYRHHKEKLYGIQKTLNQYKETAKKHGIDDLDEHLKGLGL